MYHYKNIFNYQFDDIYQNITLHQDTITKDNITFKESRLTNWYSPFPFTYSNKIMPPQPFNPFLQDLLNQVNQFLNYSFDSILVNYYQDLHIGMNWHSDPIDLWEDNFAILSFGYPRTLQFRHIHNFNLKIDFLLNHNDLLHIIDINKFFHHRLKKENNYNNYNNHNLDHNHDTQRISLVFKKLKILHS